MILFPIGTLSGGSGSGTIDSVSYNFFEPNSEIRSFPVHTTLQTRFGNMSILSRKKAQPFLTLSYKYSNIYSSEYNQVEHFIMSVDDSNISFYTIDLSKGEVPTSIDTSSTWISSIPNTRLYSNVTNLKSNYIFFYNGANWKIGTISSVSANTSVTCDVDTNNFGTLSDSDGAVVTGNKRTWIYPIYEVYLNPNSLNSFKVEGKWDNKDSNRGSLYSGTISFVTKYKVG